MALSRSWVDAIEKEERLRLRWYINNEEKIRASAANASSLVGEDKMQERTDLVKKVIQGNTRQIVTKPGELLCPDSSTEGPAKHLMKPIQTETRQIIYQKGRVPYLFERYHKLPEQRYYFPVTTSFIYGWNMWDCAKTMDMKRYGKSAIVRNTFYRRRAGIERDPEWYRSPPRISPTICNYAS